MTTLAPGTDSSLYKLLSALAPPSSGGAAASSWLTGLTGLTGTGFDPAAAQAAQAERQLARRRRGRGAMLLTGTAGLDPADAGGSVARRLLTGVPPAAGAAP